MVTNNIQLVAIFAIVAIIFFCVRGNEYLDKKEKETYNKKEKEEENGRIHKKV